MPTMGADGERPDPDQGHAREWPATPYSDEARAAEPPFAAACGIALFGDCTVACDYYPPANRPEQHLAVRLRRAFPGQPFVVRNVAAAGETAAGFMASGRMGRVLDALPKLDVALVRYGINDRKERGIGGCVDSLRALCAALRRRYPTATVFVETGIWVDYPAHYLWDRNARLGPLYDAMRAFAREAGYPLVDVYQGMAAETRRGNRDLRVRGLPDPRHTVVDDAFDAFFGDDPAYFTNVHPNSRGLGLIADWQVAAFRAVFGQTLPSASRGRP